MRGRARCPTMVGRRDLIIGKIEPSGALAATEVYYGMESHFVVSISGRRGKNSVCPHVLETHSHKRTRRREITYPDTCRCVRVSVFIRVCVYVCVDWRS